MRNRDLIVSNLQEAKEELERIIQDVSEWTEEDEEEFDAGLLVGLRHAVHHIAYAWNAKDLAYEEADQQFDRLAVVGTELTDFYG